MNTAILCFGDSNTWGYDPKDGSRYSRELRWTGMLQMLLGPKFTVIEEGLNGRTTTVNEIERPIRSGLEILPVFIESHRPLDWVILMLGTNDLKTHFDRSAEQIATDLDALCGLIGGHEMLQERPPKLILAAPTGPNVSCQELPEWFKNTDHKLQSVLQLLPEIARKRKAVYVQTPDLFDADFADGLHWSNAQHAKFAREIMAVVLG
tara:strand:- start:4940 stop:5560 length:621 start_codon:yes stop_codon:yes gene_type:complete